MGGGISYRDVSRQFGDVTALQPTSLDIEEGEFVALVGPSGCGKTTLLRLTADLDTPTTGEVTLGGATPAESRKNRQIGLVSQRPAVLPWKSAIDDVKFTQSLAGNSAMPARNLLEEFGLGPHLKKLPHELSGGMLQRVNLASAIAHDPAVLLMDEPFSALDEMKREELGIWVGDVIAEREKTVLFVTHHVDEAVLLASRILIFSASPGRIVADIRVNAPRPRKPSFRRDPEFLEVSSEVRRLLFGQEEAR